MWICISVLESPEIRFSPFSLQRIHYCDCFHRRNKTFFLSLGQRFPTWGACTPGCTFAYLKGTFKGSKYKYKIYLYIIYIQIYIHISVNIIFKNIACLLLNIQVSIILGVHAQLSKCWRATLSEKGWNPCSRETKSQIFSATIEVYETSTNQTSHSYHEGLPSTIGQKKSKFIIKSKYIVRANLSCGTFFLFIDVLLKLQQQILMHFCKSSFNSVIIVCWLWLLAK